ncbi:Profilin-4 [Lobulomyces angularis]|nr:Profilin-4 [Lobulomyces angularis]
MNSILSEALLSTKHIQHAAIIRKKDGAVKAKSNGLQVLVGDCEKINKAFDSPLDIRSAEHGLTFFENQYKIVRADNLSIYGKTIDKSGLIICKTINHYIICTYDSTMYCSVAVEAVEKLAEYFRKKSK